MSYVQDPEEALVALLQGSHWEEALRLVRNSEQLSIMSEESLRLIKNAEKLSVMTEEALRLVRTAEQLLVMSE